jgi:putative FmdB family regulatory protein
MPIYEYLCDSCGARIEALQKLSDKPLEDCSACGSPSLRKLVSAASFRLKGGGWYETDFKTGDKKKIAESDSQNNKSDGGGLEKGSQKEVDTSNKQSKSTKVSPKDDSSHKSATGAAEKKK